MNIKKMSLSLLIGTTLLTGGLLANNVVNAESTTNSSSTNSGQGSVVIQYVNALTGQPIHASQTIYGSPNSMLDLSNNVLNIPGYVAGNNRTDNGGNTYPGAGQSMTVTIAYQPINQPKQAGNWQGGNAVTSNSKQTATPANTTKNIKSNNTIQNNNSNTSSDNNKTDSQPNNKNSISSNKTEDKPIAKNSSQKNNTSNQSSKTKKIDQKVNKSKNNKKVDKKKDNKNNSSRFSWIIAGIIIIVIAGIGFFVWYKGKKTNYHFKH